MDLSQDIGQLAETYQYLRVYPLFHTLQAYLLYPPKCVCERKCSCEKKREKIVLSLNVEFYHKAAREGKSAEDLAAIKFFLKIPEASVLSEDYPHGYPLWLMQERFEKRVEEKHFQCITSLVIMFLRLSQTYMTLWREPRASFKEAMDSLVGTVPLAMKNRPVDSLRGEKAYATYWAKYRAIAPFIAALGSVAGIAQEQDLFPSSFSTEQIERILSLAHWFRIELLKLSTPNVKQKAFLSEQDLFAFPSWIEPINVDVPIEIFQEKIDAILKNAVLINPQEAFRERMERKKREREEAAKG